LAPLLVLKKKPKEVRGRGQPFFWCSCGVLLFTYTKCMLGNGINYFLNNFLYQNIY
jgi:hypothetical protein